MLVLIPLSLYTTTILLWYYNAIKLECDNAISFLYYNKNQNTTMLQQYKYNTIEI